MIFQKVKKKIIWFDSVVVMSLYLLWSKVLRGHIYLKSIQLSKLNKTAFISHSSPWHPYKNIITLFGTYNIKHIPDIKFVGILILWHSYHLWPGKDHDLSPCHTYIKVQFAEILELLTLKIIKVLIYTRQSMLS